MSEPTICEVIAETLGSGSTLSPAQTSHVNSCPACRDLQSGLAQVKAAGSAFPAVAAGSPLLARIRQSVATEPLPTPVVSGTTGPAIATAGLGAGMLLPAIVICLLLAALLWNAVPPTVPAVSPGSSAPATAGAVLVETIESMTPASSSFVITPPASGAASASSAPTQSEEGNR